MQEGERNFLENQQIFGQIGNIFAAVRPDNRHILNTHTELSGQIDAGFGRANRACGNRIGVAEAIAHKAGLSDKFIAVTVLACGTSLPELATSVVAAIKGKGQMAIGNVLGSNVANILLIVGGSALIHPLSLDGINLLDFAALGALALMLTAAAYLSREKLGRTAGAILLAIGVAYNAFLIATI